MVGRRGSGTTPLAGAAAYENRKAGRNGRGVDEIVRACLRGCTPDRADVVEIIDDEEDAPAAPTSAAAAAFLELPLAPSPCVVTSTSTPSRGSPAQDSRGDGRAPPRAAREAGPGFRRQEGDEVTAPAAARGAVNEDHTLHAAARRTTTQVRVSRR